MPEVLQLPDSENGQAEYLNIVVLAAGETQFGLIVDGDGFNIRRIPSLDAMKTLATTFVIAAVILAAGSSASAQSGEHMQPHIVDPQPLAGPPTAATG